MATKDELAQIWYADANGVITGNTPNADNVASAIIDGYNEHFGTDIQIWTPEKINLQVGDTVPNWNAYEKIEQILLAISWLGQQLCWFGHIAGNTYYIASNESNTKCVCPTYSDGIIRLEVELNESAKPAIIEFIQTEYPNINNIETFATNYVSGDTVSNWNDYQIMIQK